jgi:acetyltransferase-like isoleucine patch superfamily enzyme
MHINQESIALDISTSQGVKKSRPVTSPADFFKPKDILFSVRNIAKIYKVCQEADANFLIVLFYFLKNKIIYGKNILMHRRVIIKGIKNIKSNTALQIGLGNARFVHNYDTTYLNIAGMLFFKGNHTIGRGCRFDIAKNASVIIGRNGYINAMSTFVISHSLVIGDDCVISWNCHFLDEDYHEIKYENKIYKPNEIFIGNHVWVGCDVKIYKGTIIPNGCVIAAGSIVRGIFTEPYALIGGNPAKIIKQNINWK